MAPSYLEHEEVKREQEEMVREVWRGELGSGDEGPDCQVKTLEQVLLSPPSCSLLAWVTVQIWD